MWLFSHSNFMFIDNHCHQMSSFMSETDWVTDYELTVKQELQVPADLIQLEPNLTSKWPKTENYLQKPNFSKFWLSFFSTIFRPKWKFFFRFLDESGDSEHFWFFRKKFFKILTKFFFDDFSPKMKNFFFDFLDELGDSEHF